jgi:hypothetical protein
MLKIISKLYMCGYGSYIYNNNHIFLFRIINNFFQLSLCAPSIQWDCRFEFLICFCSPLSVPLRKRSFSSCKEGRGDLMPDVLARKWAFNAFENYRHSLTYSTYFRLNFNFFSFILSKFNLKLKKSDSEPTIGLNSRQYRETEKKLWRYLATWQQK